MILSQKALDITESLTLAIDGKSKKMKAEGLNVVGFGAGEPDFGTPEYIKNAAKQALDMDFTKYTPASGMLELKQTISNKLKRDNNLNYLPEEIIVSNGAKHSLFNALLAIINPGDEVIVPSPHWNSYPEMVKLSGGTIVFVQTLEENNFKLTTADLLNAITPNTKALILNSPNNPNGCVYTKKELEDIADIAVKKQFFVISDEVYEELIYDDIEHVSIASLSDDVKNVTITINGMSKAYAMTGWRIGYAAGPVDIIQAMTNLQSHSTSNPNSIAQYASIAALKAPKDAIADMVREFSRRRLFMVEKINSIKNLSCNTPKGAFYIMMNISKLFGKNINGIVINSSLTFSEALLTTKLVTVVPGIAFGADSYVRLSYANSMENITKGLIRIEEFVNELE